MYFTNVAPSIYYIVHIYIQAIHRHANLGNVLLQQLQCMAALFKRNGFCPTALETQYSFPILWITNCHIQACKSWECITSIVAMALQQLQWLFCSKEMGFVPQENQYSIPILWITNCHIQARKSWECVTCAYFIICHLQLQTGSSFKRNETLCKFQVLNSSIFVYQFCKHNQVALHDNQRFQFSHLDKHIKMNHSFEQYPREKMSALAR